MSLFDKNLLVHLLQIAEINESQVRDLVTVLNYDTRLREILGTSSHPDLNTLVHEVLKWMDRTNSISYAILFGSAAVGMISISHIDARMKTARIGYWISSGFWNRGVASKAFDVALQIARRAGISSVFGTVPAANTSSLAIWKRVNAKITRNGETFVTELSLDPTHAVDHSIQPTDPLYLLRARVDHTDQDADLRR